MAGIKVKVPDGDKCGGCGFLRKARKEVNYQDYVDFYTCGVFN